MIELKSFICSGNEFGLKSISALSSIFTRYLPHHLEELKLINCSKMTPKVTLHLLQALN